MEQIKETNRIVVDYNGLDDIILLAIFDTKSGEEIPLTDLGFTNVKRYDGVKDFNYLKSLNLNNEEGFVIRYESGLRLKIKFDNYILIHRIKSEFTPKHILECLKNGVIIDLIDSIPDELYTQLHKYIDYFKSEFDRIKNKALLEFKELSNQTHLITRKEKALYILKCQYSNVLFYLLDDKNIDKLIWAYVESENIF